MPPTRPVRVIARRGNATAPLDDLVAAEEPLEIRLTVGTQTLSLSVTMRTPGHDAELALGFLFGEGVIESIDDVTAIDTPVEGVVRLALRPGLAVDAARLARNVYMTSSCGVCGKASIDAVAMAVTRVPADPTPLMEASVIPTLPDKLRAAQETFERTGGLHASGLFRTSGELIDIREDVGRHNALDKLVGGVLRAGRVPLEREILLLSGRVSFELVQKAVVAGVPVVAAVGAPSSLAVELAEAFGVTLVGFVRGDRFNVYTHPARLVGL